MGCQCSKNRSAHDIVRPSSDKRSSSLIIGGNSESSDIRDFYRLGPVLGSGSFGQVRACLHRKTDQQFACKIMTKNPGKMRRPTSQPVSFVNMFKNEINILRSLDHPNVVKLVETFEDRHFLYAIMEKCDGGELFTKIVKKRRFSEVEASALCREMIAAIAYIHSRHIVHRDVKAENFLFAKSKSSHNRLVLIDFGMSVQLTDQDRYLRQVCGSPHYVAPELIRRYYKKEVDLWALGVVVFLMLYGRYPFEGADQKAIAQKILKSEPDYQRSSTPPSDLAIKFIKGLLEKDPAKRFTPQEAIRHPWVVRYAENSVTSMGTGLSGRSPVLSQARRASDEPISGGDIENAMPGGLEAECETLQDEAESQPVSLSPLLTHNQSAYETVSNTSGSAPSVPAADAVNADHLEASYILSVAGEAPLSSNEDEDEVEEDVGPLSSPNIYPMDQAPWESDEDDRATRHSRAKLPTHLKSDFLPKRRVTTGTLAASRAVVGSAGSNGNSSYASQQRKKKRNKKGRREAAFRSLRQHEAAMAALPKRRVTASKGRFI